MSFEFRAARLKKQGAPIDIVFPEEGIGWDMETTAIVKGTDKLEAAQTLVDWSVSEAANEDLQRGLRGRRDPELAQPIEYLPDDMPRR